MQSYIPSKVMMFKMMKSCINIKELERLWVIMQKPKPKVEEVQKVEEKDDNAK
tara:strand:- start:19 stop:177 length:159 start_codon:yes stop_codon:yes gene_type:complete